MRYPPLLVLGIVYGPYLSEIRWATRPKAVEDAVQSGVKGLASDPGEALRDAVTEIESDF
jgi:hypothetical protein